MPRNFKNILHLAIIKQKTFINVMCQEVTALQDAPGVGAYM